VVRRWLLVLFFGAAFFMTADSSCFYCYFIAMALEDNPFYYGVCTLGSAFYSVRQGQLPALNH